MVGQRGTQGGLPSVLIEADCGGATGNRSHAWKAQLQDFADEFGLPLAVTHSPTGASKWNPIEHRMFNWLSANWRGQPLESYETRLNYLKPTRATAGFQCRARLDAKSSRTGRTVSKEEVARLRVHRHRIFPHWNSTIQPRVLKQSRS